MTMDEKRLEAIEARTNAATPGPWEVREHEGMYALAGPNGWPIEDGNPDPAAPNFVFVAHAREDVPDLVAEVRRLRAVEAAERAVIEAAKAWASYEPPDTVPLPDVMRELHAHAVRVREAVRALGDAGR